MQQIGPVISSRGLEDQGLTGLTKTWWNMTTATLIERATAAGEGQLTDAGCFSAVTGKYTGRSPNDRFIVREPGSEKSIDWGEINRPFDAARFDKLEAELKDWFKGREAYVQDVHCGADPGCSLNVRVITEQAWHSLFAANMFREPTREERVDFVPDFTVLQAPGFLADPVVHGTNSEAFVIINFAKRLVIIGGTRYAGEIKKSIFSVMNYMLPDRGILPMHCSANEGEDGTVAVFVGLSGTGKTTLSADPERTLIGDDEHGWGDEGVFNFEGGCYAKAINLDPEQEPEIYATTRRFGTVLENCVMGPMTRVVDFSDGSLTENTRISYPLDAIPNASATGRTDHAHHVVMLTADAFGVLPPLSRLTPEQAMYHFISGYTARLAGTERGVTEPQAAFSACFGAPFMPRHPGVYARLLGEKIEQQNAECWLLNTGWTGGGHGVGHRMSLKHTRTLLHAALDGKLDGAEFVTDPVFGLHVPKHVDGVPDEVLLPREAWADKAAYDATAAKVAGLFSENFKRFADDVDSSIVEAGIRTPAIAA
ncbi:MAG: phosphoenolpyruvate carboxykinase (ATP) [Alphaproteobacteria bacterium]